MTEGARGNDVIDVRCPACHQEVQVDITIVKRTMTLGGKPEDILEISSGYEAHDCNA